MVKTKQTHVNNEDYKNGGLQLLLVHGVEDAASLSSPLCCTRSQSATCSLMKEHSAQTLSWECHAKLLTTCWTILTFTLSPLRRMFSRLTNSSASFRDSSCNKKKTKKHPTVNMLLHFERSRICYESAPTWCEESGCSRPLDSTNSLLTMHS